MTSNIEKLFAMLQMEAIKIRETNNLKEIEEFYLEVERFIKTEFEKLKTAREMLYLDQLNGKEEGEVNGYLVSYKPLERFVLDSKKLKDYFNSQGFNEVEMKNLVYSHSLTKPSLKLKKQL